MRKTAWGSVVMGAVLASSLGWAAPNQDHTTTPDDRNYCDECPQQAPIVPEEPGTGGSGMDTSGMSTPEQNNGPATGGSGTMANEPSMQQGTMNEPSDAPTATPPPPPPPTTTERQTVVVVDEDNNATAKHQKESHGKFVDTLRFGVGGGVEGYTGNLYHRVNAGPTWGVTIGSQPLRAMGVEVQYSGAVNEVNHGLAPGPNHAINGADIVRNGAQAAVTLQVPTANVQPYAVAGIGVDSYNVRGGQELGFRDDTAGRVPLGLGLRARAGAFSGDLRVQYNALFDQEFARLYPGDGNGGGYTGMLQVGARF